MHWLIAVPALLLTCSCSFMFVHGAPSGHEKLAYFDCVSSRAAPVADVAGASLGALFAVVTATASDDPDDPDDGEVSPSVPITFGVLAALQTVAAVYGFDNAVSCEQAKSQLAVRIGTEDAQRAQQLQQLQQQLQTRAAGCVSDRDCKGDRVCVDTRCVAPPTPAAPPAAAADESPPAAPSAL